MHLTSGLDPGEAGRAPTFDEAVQASMLDVPGTTFRYGPVAFQVFGALLQRTLGGEDPLRYYERRLFDPIVEKQMRAMTKMRRERSESLSRRERRRLFRRLRRIQRRTGRAIEAELTAEQVEAYRAFREEERQRWRDAWQNQR